MSQDPIVTIEMENGKVMTAELYPEIAPNTVCNFISLIQKGYYDGLIFHRGMPGFMVQGGCPDGTGAGGPGWNIKCETKADKQVHKKGSLSMAHAGPNTGGSQFFICFVACPHLDGGHTVFGEIEDGDTDSFQALDAIEQKDKIVSIEIKESK